MSNSNSTGLNQAELWQHYLTQNPHWQEDGARLTAAERLYGQPFPDLFEWLLQRMDECPMPRKRKSKVKPNSLIGLVVPP